MVHDHITAFDIFNTLGNLAIVAGYLIVPFTVLPRIALTTSVRVAGVFFFVTCALSHLAMALGVQHAWPMAVVHVVQAIAVWAFVVGFARLVVAATARTTRAASVPPPAHPDSKVGAPGGTP